VKIMIGDLGTMTGTMMMSRDCKNICAPDAALNLMGMMASQRSFRAGQLAYPEIARFFENWP
jgi:hypothetical protein